MKNSNSNLTLLIEVVGCAVLILLIMSWSSWSIVPSTLLALAAEMYAVYVRELFVFRFSTHYVFLIGNLIIIVVVVQSTKLTEKATPAHKVRFASHHFDVADQKIKSSVPRYNIAEQKIKTDPRHQMADEIIKSRPFLNAEDFPNTGVKKNTLSKEVCSVLERSIVLTKVPEKADVKPESSQLYRRTMSASYERGGAKVKRTFNTRPELIRSKTVKCGTRDTSTVSVAGRFDELNHDEFRRKIENFIEKQRKLIREELVVARSHEHSLRR